MNQHLPIPMFLSTIEELLFQLQQKHGGYLLIDSNVPRGIKKQIEMASRPKSTLEVLGGDGIKTLVGYEKIISWLIEQTATASDHLIVLAGGSLSDLGGFVAATYHRGMSLILIPTTLLSMSDAAIGGKNGVNVAGIKNAVGTVYQPDTILICPTLLSDDILSGISEIIKHAILDNHLEVVASYLKTRDQKVLTNLVERSVLYKIKVVEESRRDILNLGHTFGHALEGVLGPNCSHGAAVFLGLIGECSINGATPDIVEQLEVLPLRSIIPDISEVTFEELYDKMLRDKKSQSGHVGIISLKTFQIEYVDQAQLEFAWRKCCAYANRC